MTNVVSIDGVKDVRIKYSQKECLELSKELSGKREKINLLQEELRAHNKEIKDEIKELQKEIDSDIDTLHNEERYIPSAQIKAELHKEKKLVTIKYQNRVVSNEKYSEEKHKSLFGEITNAAMTGD